MRHGPSLSVVTVAAVLVAGACASPAAGPTSSPRPAAPTATGAGPSATASPTASEPTSDGGTGALPADLRARPAVAAAIADAADRAKVSPDEVVVAAWSPVTFTDGSMGCPKEGQSYTQALVPGELLMLRVDSGVYQYHAAAGGDFTHCAAPSAAYTVG